MGETMDFPKTPQEFIEQYKIKDSKEVYTNGSDLVPVFRVEQMIEHYFFADVAPVVQEHRISKDVAAYQDKFVRRYCPKYKDATFVCRERECKFLKCEICTEALASEMASKLPGSLQKYPGCRPLRLLRGRDPGGTAGVSGVRGGETMALIEDRIGLNGIETVDKVADSIRFLRNFEPRNGEGYYLAFSGGKDPCVVKALCDMAGVKYDAHYAVTSVDPPELIRFIKKHHPDVIFDFPKRFYIDENRNEREETITMWNLIPRKLMPPTRVVRYCCSCLKEANGAGRITLTGVRRAESVARSKNRNLVDIGSSKKTKIFLNTDNDDARLEIENCYKKRKTVVNPIIDWTDAEVWEFIETYNTPYCELYDQGYTRLGCIGCPMNPQTATRDFERYPKYKQMYLRAFARMLDERKKRGLQASKVVWDTPEDVMAWWLGEDTERKDDDQIEMFADMGIEDDDQIEMYEETPEAW